MVKAMDIGSSLCSGQTGSLGGAEPYGPDAGRVGQFGFPAAQLLLQRIPLFSCVEGARKLDAYPSSLHMFCGPG